jgi:two-component system KDP operon response regulator KdpE
MVIMSDLPIVLVVDDEIQIRRFLRARFELDRFIVHEAGTGEQGIRLATVQPPQLVFLELDLPDMDGSELLARLRSWSTVPIIIISRRSSETDKVLAFELGADDYITKPFGIAELVARARAAMRRAARVSTGEPVVRAGPLTIDVSAKSVTLRGTPVNLTRKEYMLLQILAQNVDKVVTHQFLLKEIWGSLHLHDNHYLRIFVRKLRQKIEEDPAHPRILITVSGVGYRLTNAADSSR